MGGLGQKRGGRAVEGDGDAFKLVQREVSAVLDDDVLPQGHPGSLGDLGLLEPELLPAGADGSGCAGEENRLLSTGLRCHSATSIAIACSCASDFTHTVIGNS